jgi:hypothetical protein
MAYDTQDLRLTDDMERRLVREMAYREIHGGSIWQDAKRSVSHAVAAVNSLIGEISFKMDKIGEARYS